MNELYKDIYTLQSKNRARSTALKHWFGVTVAVSLILAGTVALSLNTLG